MDRGRLERVRVELSKSDKRQVPVRATLPGPARAVIAAAFTSGLGIFAVAVVALIRHPLPQSNQFLVFATLTVFVAATWVWPLVMYRGAQSELINLDEGFFVIAALLLPWPLAVLVFALAIGVAQVVRRRPLFKVVFNWGQVVISAGLGLAVARLLAPAGPRLTLGEVAAAAVGAAVFSIFNNCAIATIVASLGTSWWGAVRDGIEIRLRLAGSCIAVAIMSALAISAYRWSLPLAVVPLIILRQVLAGHFEARHDRTRLLGLFNAALDANRSLGEGDVLGAILQSARSLLRCPDALVSPSPPTTSELGAVMLVNGEPSWLVVSGRSRTEPFDDADTALLEALAAVGAGALTNGYHYREGRFQRERLAAIASSLGEGVCALDGAATVTFMNPAAARMIGCEAPSVAATLRSDGTPADGPAIPAFLLAPALQVMQSRETVRRDDIEFLRSDGSSVPVAITASAILDDDEVAGAVIVFRDISERREVEKAIRVARDQAIEASRLKSQFLANMSHEIRTPMNGVLGMSSLLLDTEVDETQRRYLLAIRESGDNLMVIINDILDFSKIEAGKLDLEEVDFDLGASLASVANAMTVAAHERGLSLRLRVDPGLRRWVRGDPVRLRQVMTNLVSNAIKFTHMGTVTVTAASIGGGSRVRFSVTDTGIGIDPSARDRVLGAFGQADSSTTRRYGGTGLGLAICNQLVGMMGGVLDFSSQPGVGSTFWFEVALGEALSSRAVEPLVVGGTMAADAAATGATAGDAAAGGTGAGATATAAGNCVLTAAQCPPPMAARRPEPSPESVPAAPVATGDPETALDQPRVLVADDAPVNQLVASLQLKKLGYRVDVVTTGEEALIAMQQAHYDAVLMDCRMPIMDGYEATRRIRRLDGPARGTPIIAMTASAMVGDREECLLAGMDDYLSKPLDRSLLAAALARTAKSCVSS